jgi:hypothetical protein
LRLVDLGIKVQKPKLPGDRYPVMAVDDKIGFSNLHDLDRRQGRRLNKCLLYPGPALLVTVFERQEATCIVRTSFDTADNSLGGDFGMVQLIIDADLELIAHLLKAK